MDNKEKQFSLSWFFRWFLDNKAITVFLVTLLLGLNLLVLSKITFIFIPIFEFAGAVMLPVIISGLLYYLLNPIVDFLERKGLKRIFAISLVFFLIAVLLIWGVFLGIPVYASAKVVIGAIFEWYKVVSGLYEEHNEVEEETHSES